MQFASRDKKLLREEWQERFESSSQLLSLASRKNKPIKSAEGLKEGGGVLDALCLFSVTSFLGSVLALWFGGGFLGVKKIHVGWFLFHVSIHPLFLGASRIQTYLGVISAGTSWTVNIQVIKLLANHLR